MPDLQRQSPASPASPPPPAAINPSHHPRGPPGAHRRFRAHRIGAEHAASREPVGRQRCGRGQFFVVLLNCSSTFFSAAPVLFAFSVPRVPRWFGGYGSAQSLKPLPCPVSTSTNQPTNQPTHPPIHQSTNPPTHQPTNQPTNQLYRSRSGRSRAAPAAGPRPRGSSKARPTPGCSTSRPRPIRCTRSTARCSLPR